MAATHFKLQEIFYSLQGEGLFAGTPCVFVRFSGCDLECPFCDEGGMIGKTVPPLQMTPAEIVAKVRELSGQIFPKIVFTGGEPTMAFKERALTAELGEAFKGFHCAMETNGHFAAPDWLDWITWSPKDDLLHHNLVPKEIKVLMERDGSIYGGHDLSEMEDIAEECGALLFMQPLTYAGDEVSTQASTQHAHDYVMSHRLWRLGSRVHTQLGVR